MSEKTRRWLFILLGGFFVACDQVFKYLARNFSEFTWYLWPPFLGWEYFENPGVAFGLPLPNTLLLIITPLILTGFIWFLTRHLYNQRVLLGGVLIIGGALSNLTDRFFWGVTIDYLRLFTGILNIADVLIIVGIVLVFPFLTLPNSQKK